MSRFVFFGTPYVASDTLAILAERGFVPTLVVSSPDARKGRGMQLQPSPTSAYALEHGLPLDRFEKLDSATMDKIRDYECEYAVVVAYGKIFPRALIDAFPKGVLNIHYSLLPKYRGASPVETALLEGDTVTGVAVQTMAEKLDAGDIVASREVPILPTDTTRELRPRLIQEGALLLADTLSDYLSGKITPVAQDEAAATHAPKIAKEDGLLDLSGDARLNWNKYRAYAESPGTYFFTQKAGKRIRVKIRTAEYSDGTFTPLRVVPEGRSETDYASLTT